MEDHSRRPRDPQRYSAKDEHQLSTSDVISWLPKVLPTLERVARSEFKQSSHEQAMTQAGWQPTQEDWYPDTCFEVEFTEVDRRLVAVYDTGQQEIGLGLFAITIPPEPNEYVLQSVADYHAAFGKIKSVIQTQLSSGSHKGSYTYAETDIEYNCATWDYGDATLMLVQHHEGDLHLGNEASLDIRIRPSARIELPLTTNLLF